VKVWYTSNLRPLKLGDEERKIDRKIEITAAKYNVHICYAEWP